MILIVRSDWRIRDSMSEFRRGNDPTDEWEKLGPWTRGVLGMVQTGN